MPAERCDCGFIPGGFDDLSLEEDFTFRDLGVVLGIDLRECLFLLLGERAGGGALLEAAHGEFIGRFHKGHPSTQIGWC